MFIMSFKDIANLPNEQTGWSAERSAQLVRDVLMPINAALSLVPKNEQEA